MFMITKIMGIMDFATAIIILFYQYGSVSFRLFLSFAIYLLLKAFLFRGDFASFLDACIAIYMIFMLFLPLSLISWLSAIYLIQKAVVSFTF